MSMHTLQVLAHPMLAPAAPTINLRRQTHRRLASNPQSTLKLPPKTARHPLILSLSMLASSIDIDHHSIV
ncbi:hypothetical protein M422DRAFT_35008 [Sphaerobolus stellatus SS14]|uniref:Uncharacterized protein n=1 Tax=Sphaerobolus stellatus (strain SS14) TaxID=990650 RepID=A0A0C9VAZ6_SPHS4|nr:hypothetical protein M422DRAFT_35008 [Sphaerobolus stellatus SS14]